MTDRIIVGANGRKYITTEPTRKQDLQVAATELPEPAVFDGVVLNKSGRYTATVDGYTAAQMREFYNAALEEAAKVCEQFTHYGEASGIICVKAIRELKEVQS